MGWFLGQVLLINDSSIRWPQNRSNACLETALNTHVVPAGYVTTIDWEANPAVPFSGLKTAQSQRYNTSDKTVLWTLVKSTLCMYCSTKIVTRGGFNPAPVPNNQGHKFAFLPVQRLEFVVCKIITSNLIAHRLSLLALRMQSPVNIKELARLHKAIFLQCAHLPVRTRTQLSCLSRLREETTCLIFNTGNTRTPSASPFARLAAWSSLSLFAPA